MLGYVEEGRRIGLVRDRSSSVDDGVWQAARRSHEDRAYDGMRFGRTDELSRSTEGTGGLPCMHVERTCHSDQWMKLSFGDLLETPLISYLWASTTPTTYELRVKAVSD